MVHKLLITFGCNNLMNFRWLASYKTFIIHLQNVIRASALDSYIITRQKIYMVKFSLQRFLWNLKSLTLLYVHSPSLESDPLQNAFSQSGSVALIKPKLLSDLVFSNGFLGLMWFSPSQWRLTSASPWEQLTLHKHTFHQNPVAVPPGEIEYFCSHSFL